MINRLKRTEVLSELVVAGHDLFIREVVDIIRQKRPELYEDEIKSVILSLINSGEIILTTNRKLSIRD